jgi:hypothetical protein
MPAVVARRRPTVLALVGLCGLVLAGLALPAGAQSPPITIDPFSTRCVSPGVQQNIPVTGQSTQSQLSFQLFAPSGARLQGPTTVFADGGWGITFTFAGYSFTGSYEIRMSTTSTASPIYTTSVYLEVPCQNPSLEFNPTCFSPGVTQRVTFTARHFVPNQDFHSMQYDYLGPEQQTTGTILTADGHGVFTRSFSLKPPANRGYPGRASDSDGVLEALATWSPCPPVTTTSTTTSTPDSSTTTSEPDDTVPDTTTTTRPTTTPTVTVPPTIDLPPPTVGATLTVTPEIGPAGFVTAAVGTGFPPGSVVTLSWLPGIGSTTAVVAPDGTFTARILVFPNDRLGPRALVASGSSTTAFDAFLVVQSSVQPSGQNVAQINRIRRFNQR